MKHQIKSLEELSVGDVVLSDSDTPYLINSIGEVPEHEAEINLLRLYKNLLHNDDILKYTGRFSMDIKESEIPRMEFIKTNKEEYNGWTYFSPTKLS